MEYATDRRLDVERSKKIIDSLGGPTQLAREFGISRCAVSHWARRGIPEDRLQVIQLKWRRLEAVQASMDFHPWVNRF